MISRYKSGLVTAVMAVISMLLLTACGDKEAGQQKEFTDFLQNTVLRGGQQIPVLSEDQQRRFGRFVEDYALLTRSSQQVNSAVTTGILPLFNLLQQMKQPEDYVRQNDNLQSMQATLMLINQQLQSDKIRSEKELSNLKQSEALKNIYLQLYNKVVSQPRNHLLPQIQQLNTLAQSVIQVGHLLKEQGDQVDYVKDGVQFYSEQAVAQYNELIEKVKEQQQVLQQIQQVRVE